MKTSRGNRILGATIGAIGGGLLTTILAALLVSTLQVNSNTILPAITLGAFVGGVTGFVFPRLGQSLIELLG